MREYNARFAVDFDTACIVKLLNSVRRLVWPSEFWTVSEEDIIQRLLAQATCELGL